MSWIECLKITPDNEVEVIIFTEGRVVSGVKFDGENFIDCFEEYATYPIENVSHWMPLPRPPQN